MSAPGSAEISPPRRVLYLSGGGYRAAIAGIGAILALQAAGRWPEVRKIVSVSGGGLVNAWIAVRRPASEAQLLADLQDLYERLNDRARSIRQLVLVLLATTVILAAVVVGALYVGRTASSWAWVSAAVATLLVVWTVLWFAPRLFLTLDYRPFRHALNSLESTDWHREHVFVASDLWNSDAVSFIAHVNGGLIAASAFRPIGAGSASFATALRASTALPPLLPAVRLGIGSTEPSTDLASARAGRLGRKGEVRRSQRGLWLIDGGATGNLGTQTDPRITGRFRESDDTLALTRARDEAISGLGRSVDRLGVQLKISDESRYATKMAATLTLLYLRMPSDETSLSVLLDARQRIKAASPSPAHTSAIFGEAPEMTVARAIQRETQLVLKTALEDDAFSDFPLTDDERKSLEFDPTVGHTVHGAPVPDCGHRPHPWSACPECRTEDLVVDASGMPGRVGWLQRFLVRVPGVSNLVIAARTLHILYAENLREDRDSSTGSTVDVLQTERLFAKHAGIGKSSEPVEIQARWWLANVGLAGPLMASLPEPAYVRARLSTQAQPMKTALTALPKRRQGRARAVVASAYLGTLEQFGPIDLDDVERALSNTEHTVLTAIADVIAKARRQFANDTLEAHERRGRWVLNLLGSLRTLQTNRGSGV